MANTNSLASMWQVAIHTWDEQLTMRDPKDLGTEQDIKAKTDFLLQLRGELNDAADTINRIEWTRKQLTDLQASLHARPDSTSVIEAANELEQKIYLSRVSSFHYSSPDVRKMLSQPDCPVWQTDQPNVPR